MHGDTSLYAAQLPAQSGLPQEHVRVFTFNLGTRETFALPVDRVAEIRPIASVELTRAVGFASHVAAMMSWRGQIVLVHQLAQILGLESEPKGAIMIIDSKGEQGPFGLFLHAVGQVLDVPPETLHPTPGGMSAPASVSGVILREDGSLVTLLDIDRVAQ